MDLPGDFKDDDKDRSIDSSVALSDGTSTRGGTLINGKETTLAGNIDGEYAEGEYPPLPDDYSFNHSVTRGGDDDDDLEVPIDDLTDAQVRKFNFFECLAHYLNESRISNPNRKAVELAILAEPGTYVRGLDPMKRAKQEDIFMHKYLHIVNNIDDKLFENKEVRDAMSLIYKGAKRGGGSLLPPCIGSRRLRLIIYANLLPSFLD